MPFISIVEPFFLYPVLYIDSRSWRTIRGVNRLCPTHTLIFATFFFKLHTTKETTQYLLTVTRPESRKASLCYSEDFILFHQMLLFLQMLLWKAGTWLVYRSYNPVFCNKSVIRRLAICLTFLFLPPNLNELINVARPHPLLEKITDPVYCCTTITNE